MQHYFVAIKTQLILRNIRISLTSVAMPTKCERPFRPKSLWNRISLEVKSNLTNFQLFVQMHYFMGRVHQVLVEVGSVCKDLEFQGIAVLHHSFLRLSALIRRNWTECKLCCSRHGKIYKAWETCCHGPLMWARGTIQSDFVDTDGGQFKHE